MPASSHDFLYALYFSSVTFVALNACTLSVAAKSCSSCSSASSCVSASPSPGSTMPGTSSPSRIISLICSLTSSLSRSVFSPSNCGKVSDTSGGSPPPPLFGSVLSPHAKTVPQSASTNVIVMSINQNFFIPNLLVATIITHALLDFKVKCHFFCRSPLRSSRNYIFLSQSDKPTAENCKFLCKFLFVYRTISPLRSTILSPCGIPFVVVFAWRTISENDNISLQRTSTKTTDSVNENFPRMSMLHPQECQ